MAKAVELSAPHQKRYILRAAGALCATLSLMLAATTAEASAADGTAAATTAGKCITNVEAGYTGKIWQLGTDNAFAPFAYVDEKGELKGIDVELFAKVADLEGLKYRMCAEDFAQLLPKVVSGEYDGAMAGISYTVKRAQSLNYSKRYYNSAVAVVMPQESVATLNSLEAVKGKRVAVKDGTLGMELATGLKEQQQFTIKPYPNSAASMQAVYSGEADYLLEDYPVAVHLLQSGDYPNLVIAVPRLPNIGKSESYHMVVAKDNPQSQKLLTSFNQALEKLISNGDYKSIVAKYLPEVPVSIFSSDNPNLVIKPQAD